MTNTPQLLTIRDAASALQVNYATARKWVLEIAECLLEVQEEVHGNAGILGCAEISGLSVA